MRVRRASHPDHAAHVRPVRRVRAAFVALLFESLIRRVAGEVVVIACVMIARRATAVGDAVNHREMMRLFRKQRQMLAKVNLRRRRADGVEFAAILHRRLRLHVPHVDVRRAAAEEKKDRRFRRLAPRGSRRRAEQRTPEAHSRHAHRGRDKECAAVEAAGKEWQVHRGSKGLMQWCDAGRTDMLDYAGAARLLDGVMRFATPEA